MTGWGHRDLMEMEGGELVFWIEQAVLFEQERAKAMKDGGDGR